MKSVSQSITEVIKVKSLESLLNHLSLDVKLAGLLIIKRGRIVKSIELVGKSTTYLIQIDKESEESDDKRINDLIRFLNKYLVTMKIEYSSRRVIGTNINIKFKFFELFDLRDEYDSVSFTKAQMIYLVNYEYFNINTPRLLKLYKLALTSRDQVIRMTNTCTNEYHIIRTNQSVYESLNRRGLVYNYLTSVPTIDQLDGFVGVPSEDVLLEVLDPNVPLAYYKRSTKGEDPLCTNTF